MKLLVIVLSLLSERYLIHHFSASRFYWFPHYLRKISENAAIESSGLNPWVLLLLIIFPLLLITATIFYLFQGWVYGLVGFLLNLVLFYYCLGPINPFYPLVEEGLDREVQTENYFFQVNRQLFAPILWFILTGPIGLLCYRLITLCLDFAAVAEPAKIATDILEWLPVRMTAFLCMLVGNFQQGLIPFKTLFFSGSYNNSLLSGTVGLAALRSHADDAIAVPLAQNRINQALIVLLVIVALGTHAAWW